MKLSSIIALLFLLISFNSHGQSDKMKEKREQIKSMKVGFLTTELELSSTEAEKFWPIYNKYDEKIMVLKEAQMKLRIQKRIGTDEEALKKIEEAEEQKLSAALDRYYQKTGVIL